MEALTQLFIALLAISISSGSHYVFLNRLKKWVGNTKIPSFVSLLMVFYGITLSQLVAALWFALGFEASIYLGLGSFGGDDPIAFIDVFLLVGLEAMTGFLLVSCSATLIFKTMKH